MKDEKIQRIMRPLFSPGEIRISPEALQSLKDAGLAPADLINRHVQGDWNEGPGKWIARNHEVVSGREDGPIMSVYRLYPGETRISVGTTADRSETSIRIWPEPDGHRCPLPIDEAERAIKESGGMSNPARGRSVAEIFGGWGKNKSIARADITEKGPRRFGPDR